MISIKDIANALGKAKETPGGWLCQCPCHDDREGSLSLKLTKNDKLAVNCFAGCDWEIIFQELRGRGLLPKLEPKNRRPRDIIYSYTDEKGVELFQKIRTPDKKGRHRRIDPITGNFIWNIQGIRNVLYNLPKVLAHDVIYLCEGEKDADNLNARGLVATTNNCGAVTWNDTFTETLKGKTVIICQDNDEAGRKRTAKLQSKLFSSVKELLLFEPPNVPEKGDVTDWIEAGGNASDIFSLSKSLHKKEVQEDKSKHATRDQYFKLFDLILSKPRKCIFSEKLMTFDTRANLWNPAVNYLDVIKSELAVANETQKAKYSMSLVQPHFFAYEMTKAPEFLIELPEWDEKDRISEMAYMVNLRPGEVDQFHFSELLKEWMATMFRRLHDPMVQNHILVLQGDQGVGKDTWISMLVDGLDQFAVPLSIMKEDKDMYLKLHRGLVMKIPEFDRTAKTEVSTLKDIITTPSTDIRAPYDKDSKIRHSRCSFISSANIENLLRDYTGNRRYMIFEVESIEYAYEKWSAEEKKVWRLQCLAQADYMAKIEYKASAASRQVMKDYIEMKTPDDPADDTYREYVKICRKENGFFARETLTENEISEITRQIKDVTGMNIRAIREQLRRKCGTCKREGSQRFWEYRLPGLSSLQ